MTQLVIANPEDEVRDKLQDLARGHGRSVGEEVHDILREAVSDQPAAPKLGTRLARRFAACRLDGDIPELREHPVNPPSFDA